MLMKRQGKSLVDNPLLKRLAKQDSGHHGRVAEKKVAKRLGGRTQPEIGRAHV